MPIKFWFVNRVLKWIGGGLLCASSLLNRLYNTQNQLSPILCDVFNCEWVSHALWLGTMFALIHLTKWHTVEMVSVLALANLVLVVRTFFFLLSSTRLLVRRLFLTLIIHFFCSFAWASAEKTINWQFSIFQPNDISGSSETLKHHRPTTCMWQTEKKHSTWTPYWLQAQRKGTHTNTIK